MPHDELKQQPPGIHPKRYPDLGRTPPELHGRQFTDKHIGDHPNVDDPSEYDLDYGVILTRSAGFAGPEYSGSGTVYTNVPHLAVYHSPDGYEFGYGGSGPSDLALNIIEHYLARMPDFDYEADSELPGYQGKGSFRSTTFLLYQFFRRVAIEDMKHHGGIIIAEHIVDWIRVQLDDMGETELLGGGGG